MKQRESITDRVILRGYKRQYQILQKDKNHAFTPYEKEKNKADEQTLFANLFDKESLYPTVESFQTSSNLGDEIAHSDSGNNDNNLQQIDKQDKNSSNSNTNFEITPQLSNERTSFSSSENSGTYRKYNINQELSTEANTFLKGMQKMPIDSLTPEEDKVFACTCILLVAVVGSRIWYELTNENLPKLLMAFLNVFAFGYTLYSIKLDIDHRIADWIIACNIRARYKEAIKEGCKTRTRKWLLKTIGLVCMLLFIGSKTNFFVLFNDVLSIAALGASLSSTWFRQKALNKIEKMAVYNISFE